MSVLSESKQLLQPTAEEKWKCGGGNGSSATSRSFQPWLRLETLNALAFTSFSSHNTEMPMNITSKLSLLAFISLFSLSTFVFAAEHPAPSMSPDAALAKLNEGNARFSGSKVSEAKPTAARRAETAQAQHPFALVLGCSDSRTSLEIVFDQNI